MSAQSRSPAQPLIAVDIGNTNIHFGWFPGGQGSETLAEPASDFTTSTATPNFEALAQWLPPGAERWFGVSVNRTGLMHLRQWVLSQGSMAFTLLDHHTLVINAAVDHPEQVGTDRLAAAVAANHLRRPGQPAIVVDAGTAITVDAVSADGRFLGGAILPGLAMSAKALTGQTDLLPEVAIDPGDVPAAIGANTSQAIRSGLYWGTVGAVRETIDRVGRQLSEQTKPQVFFSGGNMSQLAQWLGPEVT
ncbi:MAG: type III pantothenate kinase, partial [Pirellulaceae bacterium]